MMNKREEFLKDNKKFFDSGYVKEVYVNEYLSIMNICNSLYAVSEYSKSSYGNMYYAFMVTPNQVRKIITDNSYFFEWVLSLDKEMFKKITMAFDEKNFRLMKEIEEETRLNGPSEFVDLQMEEELRNMGYGKSVSKTY